MSHRITTTASNGVQDGPGPRPTGPAPIPARPANRILVASVEPFALWAHRWGRLDTVLAAPDVAAHPVGADPASADAADGAADAEATAAGAPLACSEDERTVAYADAAARAAGVVVGMTLAGARQRVPTLVVLPAAGPEVDAAWEAFLDGMHEVAPRVAAVRTGVVAFDGDAHDAAAFAERTGARVGGAGTVEEARLLAYTAEPGRARVVAPHEDPWTKLDPAPTYLLGGVGLSPAERERLAWLGVDTIGTLRRWTPAQLRAYLGEAGGPLVRVLHGPRTARLPRRLPPPVVSAEHAFEDAAREPAEIDPVLERLVRRAAHALGERSAERVRVVAATAGLRSDATRRAKEPLRDPVRLLRLARLALEDAGLVPLGVDELRVELSGLARHAEAGELWPQRHRRAQAARAVHARFPGQARRFALHDPDALRPRQRWRLLDLASGDPLTWDGPAPRDGTIGPSPHTTAPATAPAESRPGRTTAADARVGSERVRARSVERTR